MLHYLKDANLIESLKGPVVARIENVSRRSFLKGTASGAGLVVAMQVLPAGTAAAFDSYPTGAADMPNGVVNDPNVFVSIDPDGTVTITAHRSEMGTGVRTTLPMVVADEMGADWGRVRIAQAPGDEPTYGNQDTDGSRSMRHFIQPMRECGAAIRSMLEQAAAERWGVDVELCRARNHEVVLLADEKWMEGVVRVETDQRLGYGELAEAAQAIPVPPREALAFKDEADFRYIGKGEVGLTDLHDITTGKATYGADVKLPGMKIVVIARPPVVGGKVRSFDAAAALEVPGVQEVVELEGKAPPAKFYPLGGIAVVADNTHAAIKGRDALVIEWDHGPHAVYNTGPFTEEMRATAKEPGKPIRDQGDVDGAFASAARTFVQEYFQPHMAHVTMEPPVAVARVDAAGAEIWAPVQSPYGARQDLSEALGVPIENVRVNVTLLGGGFGRKSKCDYAIEAALISQKLGGAPVKVQWTREDDVHHSFMHTTSVERIEAAMDDSGRVVGWRHNSVAPTILSTFTEDPGYQFFIEHGMGLVDVPFDVPNLRCENGKAMAHARIGWFRAVSNIPRAFAIQSFVAELAHELGRDQKEFLIELIGPDRKIDPATHGFPEDYWNYGENMDVYPIDTARLKAVVELAAEEIGWGKDLPAGEGIGIAVHRSFVTYVATAVRVKIGEDGVVRVPEVHMAVDCGYAVHPERIRAQMEGAAVMGMTVAKNSAVTFTDGRVDQSNYNDYDVARIDNYPELVKTHIVEHGFDTPASGVGEPGVPPFPPALYNAVFNATGKRLRDLPLPPTLNDI